MKPVYSTVWLSFPIHPSTTNQSIMTLTLTCVCERRSSTWFFSLSQTLFTHTNALPHHLLDECVCVAHEAILLTLTHIQVERERESLPLFDLSCWALNCFAAGDFLFKRDSLSLKKSISCVNFPPIMEIEFILSMGRETQEKKEREMLPLKSNLLHTHTGKNWVLLCGSSEQEEVKRLICFAKMDSFTQVTIQRPSSLSLAHKSHPWSNIQSKALIYAVTSWQVSGLDGASTCTQILNTVV